MKTKTLKKLLFLFLVTIICISTHGQNQWFMQNPEPLDQSLKDVHVFSETSIITAGPGYIIKTTDNGISWDTVYEDNNSKPDFCAVFFTNDNHGYVLSTSYNNENSILVKSEDGGFSWNMLNTLPDGDFHDMHFVDETTGWIAGRIDGESVVVKTENGGNSWNSQLIEQTEYLHSVFFYNDQIGFVGGTNSSNGNGILHKTIDGGETWTICNIPDFDRSVKSIIFLDEYLGYVAYSTHKIIKTTDVGTSWFEVFNDEVPIYSLCFIDCLTGWASLGNTLIKTEDGGLSWNNISFETAGSIKSIKFIEPMTGWFVGYVGTVYKTTNGGSNWEKISGSMIPTSVNLQSMHFENNEIGWIAGKSPGIILNTHNGGDDWEVQFESNNFEFIKIFFIGNQNGWAISTHEPYDDLGIIFRTSDGGENWDSVSTVPDWPTDIYFQNNNIGFLLTGQNTYRTINGGITWYDLQISPLHPPFVAICFSGNNGWISSGYATNWWPGFGCIYKSVDAGQTWDSISSPPYFSDIQFINADVGWGIGWACGCEWCSTYIYKTTDGGFTWELKYSTDGVYENIYFLDENHGWAGLVYTSDGGESWQEMNLPGSLFLWDVFFTTPDTGWGINGCGIWKNIGGGMITGVNNEIDNDQITEELHTFKCYPNPGSGRTSINFSIPADEFVLMRIFDSKGRDIETLVSENLPAGNHQFTWNSNNLKNGMYFIRMETKNISEVTKVLLIK